MDCSRAASKNPDRWLEKANDFARPICSQLREWIIRWEPDLTESVKWNCLCFSGRKLVCALSACKKHVGLAFFRGTELHDPASLFSDDGENVRIRSLRLMTLEGFPREALRKLLHAAVVLDGDPDILPPPPRARAAVSVPDYLAAALRQDKKAAAGFASFAPTYQREYIAWLAQAKRPETRARRLAETLAALAHGRKWLQRKG